MTIETLIKELKALADSKDPERAHGTADDLLIEFINNPEVKEAFDNIEKWYA